MRQVVIPRYGGPDVFETREVPDPVPGDTEIRIRVRAAGVNFADVLARLGLYPDAPKPPMVVGYEVAGRVDAVGQRRHRLFAGRSRGRADALRRLRRHGRRAGRRRPSVSRTS